MLKVLIVMPCYYPAMHYGGPVAAVHQMNKALAKEGIDITVYTTNANGPVILDVPVCEVVDVEGVKVHYFPIPFGSSYFYSPKLGQALKNKIKDFDIVHINWLYVYTTLIAARLCSRMKVPYILTPHGMLDSYSISLKGHWKKKLYIKFVEKPHLLNAALVHYSSSGEKKEAVVKDWRINTTIVPNGVEIEDIPSRTHEGQIYDEYPELLGKGLVLFIGRLNYIKGLDLLLKAWPQVLDNVKDAHLVIAGPDSNGYMDHLKKIAIAKDINRNVTFTGMVLGEKKNVLFHISDLFISSSYLESFGMSIVEAMLHSLPVVITDRVNIKDEIERNNAGLVSSCSPDNIAINIIDLLSNKNKAKKMGENGKRLVYERFLINGVAKEMSHIYKSVACI